MMGDRVARSIHLAGDDFRAKWPLSVWWRHCGSMQTTNRRGQGRVSPRRRLPRAHLRPQVVDGGNGHGAASCSRAMAMSAPEAASAATPPIVQRSRTRSQVQMNSATANADVACDIPGMAYM